MKPTPAGRRNRRVTIESRSTSVDAYGAQLNTWTPVATVWAYMRGLNGRELQAAQQINTEVSHKITLTYLAAWADPKEMAKRRVNFGGRFFNIHASINTDERNFEVVLYCSEGMNDG